MYKRNKRIAPMITMISMIIIVSLACNLPTSTTVAPDITDIPSLPDDSAPEALPTNESIETQPPTSEQPFIETELPTFSMSGGSGYIFSTQQSSSEDRDIWWNSSGIVPSALITVSYVRLESLGQIGSPAEVAQINTQGMISEEFEPVLGEGFAIEIERDGVFQYAIIRVVSLENRILTFDWVYPFAGEIIDGQ